MKARILALLIVLATAFLAMGQVLPNLPQNSVYGRLGIGTGPGQAIPFANLINSLLGSLGTITGDVTFSAGGVSTVSANAVTNAKAAQVAAFREKCNPSASTANLADCRMAYLHSKDIAGVVGDGSNDDTTGLQNWINACQTNSIVCFLDAGTYKTTVALAVTSPIRILGAGHTFAVLVPAVGINGINIQTGPSVPVTFESFGIAYATQSSATAITLGAVSTNLNTVSIFRDLHILNPGTCIGITQASAWTIDRLDCENFNNIGVSIQNTVSPNDAGDNIVTNSYLQGAAAGANACFLWTSGGGTHIVNNNCVGSGTLGQGVLAQLISAGVTGQLQIQGNTFDANGITGVQYSRAGATGTFGRLLVQGNICNRCLTMLTIPNDASGNSITDVLATGNIYFGQNTASAIAFNVDSATNLLIDGNVLNSQNSGTIKYKLGAAVTACTVVNRRSTGTFAADSYGSACSIDDMIGMASANLPSNASAGSRIFVTDGTPGSATCAGSSTGSTGFRQNAAWKCF